MSFPKYPAYKDSGVRWLGSVPDRWTVTALKHVFNVVGGSTPKSEVVEYWDGEHVWVTPADLSSLPSFDIRESSRRITTAGLASCGANLVPAGSIVLSTRAPIGSLAIAGTDLCTNQGCKSLVRKGHAHPRFYAYLLSIVGEELNVRGRGTTFLELSADALGAFEIIEPTPGDQAAIANFLDHETAKIDALVEEQKRLIELLKEKRQAVISQAVTKGLDPNVPVKGSGVEWLGNVPSAWKVSPLKRLCALLKDGTHLPPTRVADGIPLLSVRNVQGGVFSRLDDDSMISEESYKELCRSFVPHSNDVLLAIVGATLGKTALVPEEIGRFHIQRSLAIFRPEGELTAEWLHLVFQSSGFQALLWESVGFSAQPGIYLGTLAEVRVPLPLLHEQKEIGRIVRERLFKLDQLITEAENGVLLLGERRAAMISAAVTGKIDVRGLVPMAEDVAA